MAVMGVWGVNLLVGSLPLSLSLSLSFKKQPAREIKVLRNGRTLMKIPMGLGIGLAESAGDAAGKGGPGSQQCVAILACVGMHSNCASHCVGAGASGRSLPLKCPPEVTLGQQRARSPHPATHKGRPLSWSESPRAHTGTRSGFHPKGKSRGKS